MSWQLFLDDQWDDEETPDRHPPAGFIPARSSSEAIRLTQEKGLPSFISFDHDLSGEDDAMEYLRWIIQAYYEEPVPGFTVHSANPVGKANIIAKMNSWKKSQSL